MIRKSQFFIFTFLLSFSTYFNAHENPEESDKNKKISFLQRVALFEYEFKNIPKAADFNAKIIALATTEYSYAECFQIINTIKESHRKKKSLLSINDFYDAKITHYSAHHEFSTEDYDQTQLGLLHTAYHEAAHAVAAILINDNLDAFSYVTIIPVPHSANIPLCNYFDSNHYIPSDEDFIQNKHNNVQISLAGGIGEQIFKVPSKNRIDDDFDENDTNQDNYDLLECITRMSVNEDVNKAWDTTDFIIRWNHNNFEKNFTPCGEERFQVLLQSYQSIKPQLEQHKDKIEKLAHQLVEKKTMYADEVYEICGKKRPKFYFEK